MNCRHRMSLVAQATGAGMLRKALWWPGVPSLHFYTGVRPRQDRHFPSMNPEPNTKQQCLPPGDFEARVGLTSTQQQWPAGLTESWGGGALSTAIVIELPCDCDIWLQELNPEMLKTTMAAQNPAQWAFCLEGLNTVHLAWQRWGSSL
jgi:hypothetical protein